ncbi:MAG: hypothetical protein WC917_03655 [Bacilli bacterium]|jgi:hypothetical protein
MDETPGNKYARKMSGSVISFNEDAALNKKIPNRDLVLATLNPLVEAEASTIAQLTFSKPFYPTIWDNRTKRIDKELTTIYNDNLNDIGFIENAIMAVIDGFELGRGVQEFGYRWDKDYKMYLEYGMERRPPDTFLTPVNSNIKSDSKRWKGMYRADGIIHYDQTVYNVNQKGFRQAKITPLNSNQIFSVAATTAKYTDGPGVLEFIIPFLDGAQNAFKMIHVVMGDQINPKELKITNPTASDSAIAKEYLQTHNGVQKMGLPDNFEVSIPDYKNRQDILEFFKFFEKLMYRVIFPVAAISGEGGGILDNSSNIAKEDVFYSFIDFWRAKVIRPANIKGNNWLKLNGYNLRDYRFELLAAPVAPRNAEIEAKIMTSKTLLGVVKPAEMRNWLNSSVQGLKLEDLEEEELQDMQLNTPDSINKNKTLTQVVNGDKDLEDLQESNAQKVAKGQKIV